ncbi:hypothetical protein BGZ60DRAFT_560010 [Tricladium varicosporioides]|nr:hypothetical protein BGZ60DRAFT_560010 [Hymenoscyphus varicosporioides]
MMYKDTLGMIQRPDASPPAVQSEQIFRRSVERNTAKREEMAHERLTENIPRWSTFPQIPSRDKDRSWFVKPLVDPDWKNHDHSSQRLIHPLRCIKRRACQYTTSLKDVKRLIFPKRRPVLGTAVPSSLLQIAEMTKGHPTTLKEQFDGGLGIIGRSGGLLLIRRFSVWDAGEGTLRSNNLLNIS